MKNNITEIVFILDRSGSMGGLESETIGGYNSLLKKQKELPGEAVVTTVLFDNEYEVLHDRINSKAIKPITEDDYFVRGTTALLDAIGKTISKIETAQKNTMAKYKADKVIVAITTDGMENASKEYSLQKIKEIIEHKQERFGWEFMFLGANMDAIFTAQQMGIKASHAANFHADSVGVEVQYDHYNEVVSRLRMNKVVKENWQEEMEDAYQEKIKEIE
ncbi:MAG: vWA domain-containing protein [Oscillospiraceae bacterium]